MEPDPQPHGPARRGAPGDQLASVTRHEEEGVVIAAVRGEIDLSNAARIGRELTNVSNRAVGLVVDLGHLDYLDSTGIALLYDLHLRLERRGQGLVVVAPTGGAPRRVLELTSFDTRAALTGDVSAAVAALRGPEARGQADE